MLGDIAYSQESVFTNFVRDLPVEGKRVLEIGGALPRALVERAGVASWVAVDPRNEDAEIGSYKTWGADAATIELASASVDVVFTCNALEHVRDLPGLLRVLYRALVPGGCVYAHFGPIWSGPDGHHLETVFEGMMYDAWSGGVLPHWSHLALTEPELADLLAARYPADVASHIAAWVHRSDELNRLFLEDFVRTFSESPLSLRHLGTAAWVDYPCDPDVQASSVDMRRRARAAHPGHDLDCREILAILRKPA